jgi:myosin heavy subunit
MPDSSYILTQVRYLGVLQTIFIRKNTFPARKTYNNFRKEYDIVFRSLSKGGKDHEVMKQIMNDISAKKDEFLLGKVRVYMTS